MLAWLAAEQADLATTMAAGKTVTMSGAVAASATLTLAANPSNNDTLTVGAKTYRFRNTTAQANDVKIGASAAATITNLVAAIKANGTGDGTDYHTGTTANATVDAADGTGDTVTLTALTAGVAGNLIAVSETFTDAGNVLSGEYLSGGLDLSVFTNTGHGYDVGEGPFVITAGTTLPAGYTAGDLLWIRTVPTANTFTVTTEKGSQILKTFVDDGTGTLTFRRKDSEEAIYELLKQKKSVQITNATDIDDLT
jgi:hypothetical protein